MSDFLYQDRDIVVCIKASGLLSEHSDSGNSIASILTKELDTEIYPVHRLDRETSGVMAFAKTSFAAAALSAQIADKRFEKEYICVVAGVPEHSCGEYEDLLFKDSSKNKSFVVSKIRKGVKKASLSYNTLATAILDEQSFSLVRVRLNTGRTHQIRVQFSSRGLCLCGDRKYGSRIDCPMALHSFRISFNHPYSKKKLEFLSLPSKELFPWNLFDENIYKII